jgi:hypothetical protein
MRRGKARGVAEAARCIEVGVEREQVGVGSKVEEQALEVVKAAAGLVGRGREREGGRGRRGRD